MQATQSATPGYYAATKHLPCPYEGCGRMFTCNHNVQQHIREFHTRERPYQCQFCTSDFARPASLFRHQRGVHNYEPDTGTRGRPRGPRVAKKKQGLIHTPTPAVPSPLDHHTNINNDQNYIDPQVLQQAMKPASISPITCFSCGLLTNSQDEWLVHSHIAHGDPYNEFCKCSICCSTSFARPAPQQEQQQPVSSKLATTSPQQQSNSLLHQPPPTTKQPPTIRHPTPLRTLDFNTLSALDERLKRVQATQVPDADSMEGVESRGASEAHPIKVAKVEARPDSGLGFDMSFNQGNVDLTFGEGHINDYAKPFDFSAGLEDLLNEFSGYDNRAAGQMAEGERDGGGSPWRFLGN